VKNADRISAAVILGICLYFWIEARGFSPLSGFFPQVIIVILAALVIALTVGFCLFFDRLLLFSFPRGLLI